MTPVPRPSSIDARGVVDAMADVVLVIDDQGVVTMLNRAVERILGLDPDEWIGRSVLEMIHPDDVAEVLSSIGSLGGKEVGTPIEIRVRDVAGAWHLFEIIGSNALEDARIGGLVCVARDVTPRRMWEFGRGDVARFQRIVQVSPAMVLLLDAAGVVASVNGAFTRLLGHDPTAVVGAPLWSFAAAGTEEELRRAFGRLGGEVHTTTVEIPMRVAGEPARSRPIRFEMVDLTADPLVAGVVVSGSDVSDLQAARQELEHLARHDSLTGLANRPVLVERLERLLEQARPLAVLFIDLDRFKPVNDLYGHEIGDELLRLVARRLERVVRPNDLVARVGGDEFVVVAVGIESRGAATWLADRIETVLADPYPLEVGPVRVGASIGVTLADGSSTVAGLLADADIAMYDAKSDRRGAVGRSMAERRRSALERRRLAEEFVVGVDRGEIVAHLQPIVEVASGRVVGVEALARWQHPQLGLLRPGAFMDLVEDAGMDLVLGDAVFVSACAAMAGLPSWLRLAVNLSVGQLAADDLATRLLRVASHHGLAPTQLVVEVTEQAMLARGSTVGGMALDDTMRALHDAGVSISLDDFGTGYSSLTHVRRFPLRSVKIDRSFVAGVADEPQDRAVVEVVVGLARALRLEVIAEGVERPEQLAALGELGCDQAQGFLLAEPMPAAVARAWLLDRLGA